MDKKDIYEHLARIYLDASSKRKNKSKLHPKLFKNLSLAAITCIFALSLFLFSSGFHKNKPFDSEIALILAPDSLKINFNFDPARKETFTLCLNNLNLNRFKTLAFSAKKANPLDLISLKVEFISAFKERSEVYFKDLPHKWQDYKINLAEFKGISDWSEILNLCFSVEEWNAKQKKGVVYIDNVRLIQ